MNPNNPYTNDSNDNPFMRRVAVDPIVARRVQREQIAHAAKGLESDASAQVRTLVAALAAMDDAAFGMATNFIRNTTKPANPLATADQIAYAQSSLNAQREIVRTSTQQAQSALTALKPLVFAGVVVTPQDVSEAQIADRKADLASVLEAAGGNSSGANVKAQALIHQAVVDDDSLTIFVLCGAPFQFRAQAFGLNQTTLQSVYAAAQLAKAGKNPMLGIGAVPGADMVQLLPQLPDMISEANSAATQALAQLAADCRLQ